MASRSTVPTGAAPPRSPAPRFGAGRAAAVPCPGPLHDPAFPFVVRLLERHREYRQAAAACPDLASPHTPPAETAARCNVVLVHGGLSNCLTDFGDSLIGGPEPLLGREDDVRSYRFEHDTWLPIRDNVADLVRLIRQKLFGHLLLFIAFSRGGIVAVRAAARLCEGGAIGGGGRLAMGTHRNVLVMTFGSPHRGFGTADVVSYLPRLGYCAQFGLSQATDALPPSLRRAIFLSSLRRLRHLPPGIAELSPANPEFESFIASAAGRRLGLRVHSFGGAPAEVPWLPTWCRGLLVRPIPGIGDGAVSLNSATGYGARRSALAGCRHNDYFRRAEVRQAIAGQIGRMAGDPVPEPRSPRQPSSMETLPA